MYQVSNLFKVAASQPVQTHRITGTIGSIAFNESNIKAGSMVFSNQCTDTSDVVLGSAYIGQLTATFVGINLSYSAWTKKKITLSFGLLLSNNTWEDIPMGIYTIKEAKHTAEGVQITAYDNMYKFDKVIKNKKTILGFVTDSMWSFIDIACTKCHVTLGMTKAQIDALPNGYRAANDIEIYGDAKDKQFANDITTYRDLIYWCAQTMGCFATINRSGQLVFKQYTQTIADEIDDEHRLSGAQFEDYTTHYSGIYVTDMDTNEDVYYGYDASEIAEQISECQSDITDTQTAIEQNIVAIAGIDEQLAELKQKYENHEITEEQYITQKTALDNQKKELKEERKQLNNNLKQLQKKLQWLLDELAAATDEEGAVISLGANPFVQYENPTKRGNTRMRILQALGNVSYTPFSCSTIMGAMYDLGDVLHFSGGWIEDAYCCLMAYDYTYNGEYVMHGYGSDPEEVMVKSKAQKMATAAGQSATKAEGGGGYIVAAVNTGSVVEYTLNGQDA